MHVVPPVMDIDLRSGFGREFVQVRETVPIYCAVCTSTVAYIYVICTIYLRSA